MGQTLNYGPYLVVMPGVLFHEIVSSFHITVLFACWKLPSVIVTIMLQSRDCRCSTFAPCKFMFECKEKFLLILCAFTQVDRFRYANPN